MSQPVPILFIHGFNSFPETWDRSGFRPALVALGADPDLLRLFHYGWDTTERERPYNNTGDIRAIASRLSYRETDDPDTLRSQVRRLSAASVARGGPARVTLVAHSMGGLVARYYLSRRTPDAWGTHYEGNVQRLITIATPHLGVVLARVTRLVPADAFIWKVLRWLDDLPFVRGMPAAELARLDAQVQLLQRRVHEEERPIEAQGLLDSPALRQLAPNSPLMRTLNDPDAFPLEVEADLIWGDIRITGAVRWGPLLLWARTIFLGDLLIPVVSASTLPYVATRGFPQRWARTYRVQIGDPDAYPADLDDLLPPVAHSPLLANPAVHETVARLVGLLP